jgi:hypothetical protein
MKNWLNKDEDMSNVITKEAVKQKVGKGWHGKMLVLRNRLKKEEGAKE